MSCWRYEGDASSTRGGRGTHRAAG
jgi:hypothetical protein